MDASKDVQSIFDDALEIDDSVARQAFIDTVCAGNSALRAEVVELLNSEQSMGGQFMSAPVAELNWVDPEVPEAPLNIRGESVDVGESIGPYKLVQVLGEGGMGSVYMAEQTKPVHRYVALKIIKLGMDTKEVVSRFEAERQALAMMDHPNIAKVFEAGATVTGRPYFVMELVKGVSLTKYCDELQLPVRERLQLFLQACRAIQHAHQKGIIHRDIKPSNVLVTIHDNKPTLKVIDFGIAKAVNQKLTEKTLFTQQGAVIGTLEYMSPEQAEMSALGVDVRSDIYSLGALLYELLTGTTPLERKKTRSIAFHEVMRSIRELEPPKPSTRITSTAEASKVIAKRRHTSVLTLAREVKGDLDWIAMKALEKDRTRRYESATALARDIERYLNDEAVEASPPSFRYTTGKFVRKHKGKVIAAAALLLTLLVGIAAATWQAIRATHAEELANKHVVEIAAERDAKDLARKDAESVSSFLAEVFQSPDPARNGRSITVVESLDRAAKKIETDLAGQPERRASLQHTLGQTYHALGLYRDAIVLLEKSRDYQLATHGADAPGTRSIQRNLAFSYDSVGRREDALKLREELVANTRKLLGPEHPDTLGTMHELAISYEYAGRRNEARKLQEDILPLYQKVLGANNPATLSAMSNLGISYSRAGRLDEALKIQEQVLAIRRVSYGPEHPDSIEAASRVANCYSDMGKHPESVKRLEEVVALRRKVLGPEHSNTLVASSNLAIAYAHVGRHDDTLKLREEILALRKKTLGPDHPDTLMSMSHMAMSYIVAGKRNEGVKLQEDALALFRKVMGPVHPHTLMAMHNLAEFYFGAGQRSEAIELQEQTLAQARKVLGAEHAQTLAAMGNLARYYADANRLNEALALRIELTERSPKDSSLSQGVAVLLAWFDKGTEHADFCRRVHALASTTTDHAVAERAAKAYCLRPSSDPELLSSALTLARRAVELCKYDKPSGYQHMTLGMAEYRSGDFAAADQALCTAEKLGNANRPVRGAAEFFHVMVLLQQGKEPEARKLFSEAEKRMKPLPDDERKLFTGGGITDDTIVWLSYKEAKALLQAKAQAAPPKPPEK